MPKYISLWQAFLLVILISVVNCGIPGLHKWLINNFPSCVKVVQRNRLLDVDVYINRNSKREKIVNNVNRGNELIKNKEGDTKLRDNNKIQDVDNLLFDLNQLLHKANVEFCSYNNYFYKLSSLIKNVLKKFHPKKNVIFAIDGICPFSKLKLQIKRRAKIKLKENKDSINDITCGSIFIEKIGHFLTNFVKYLVSLEKYSDVKFYISTDKEVGEGELKLMNWITSYVKKDERDDNKTDEKREEESFVIVGADADLLLQCLALRNIRNVYIYTFQTFYLNMDGNLLFKKEKHLIDKPVENNNDTMISSIPYDGKKNELTNSGETLNNLVNINRIARKKITVLYNLNIFINLFLNKYPMFFNQIKRDLLILFILKGNDYLPKVREGNFSVFFEAYFKMLEDNMKKAKKDGKKNEKPTNVDRITYNGFLNKDYELNRKEFLKFLNYVQKVVNFSSSYLSRNTEEGNYANLQNSGSIEEFKESQLYLPLYLLNEIIKKKIIENENIDIQIEKDNEGLYTCKLGYLKNKDKIKKYYCGISKRKKVAMHIASSKFIENELPLFIKYVDYDLLKRSIKEIDGVGEINSENVNVCVDEKKLEPKLENFDNENNLNELGMNIFTKDEEKEDRKMEIYLKKFYIKNCKKKKNYEHEMKICENYIEGIKWLVEMYTKTYCINFNFFYKYSISPSLLSLYYYLCQDNVKNYNNDYKNIIQNINLNIFKNNSDYYKFINFCVNKYNEIKLKLRWEEQNDKNNPSNSETDGKRISKESISFSSVGREKDNMYRYKNSINYYDNKYFENIYDILLSKNINIVKKNVEKLNEMLRKFPKTKIIKYYWDIYAKKLKKFYKIIYYKSKKIFVAKVSLFNIELETKFNNTNNDQLLSSKNKMDRSKPSEELDNLDFNIKNNYISPHNNLRKCNKKSSRLFSTPQNNDSNTNRFSKKVIKIKTVKLVYR
ncbi:5'-3' exonuclease, putative [Plasmodium vinckei vinckei]|uniref:5'-3' exonuclease, putative n=1 Tax=Plasmodium vinckei vinckei TaxID=54757 RepID=A0A449BMS8_PLAVN|nr:5'-3' exonuclease, putative [Plasmodium vinckei vinckei]VEV54761.1 5'-3' exonuclease, putative [Plasmodium vinckei vinckei]